MKKTYIGGTYIDTIKSFSQPRTSYMHVSNEKCWRQIRYRALAEKDLTNSSKRKCQLKKKKEKRTGIREKKKKEEQKQKHRRKKKKGRKKGQYMGEIK